MLIKTKLVGLRRSACPTSFLQHSSTEYGKPEESKRHLPEKKTHVYMDIRVRLEDDIPR